MFDFGDKVKLKDGFEGKVTGITRSNPPYYDVTDANNKRINGVPEQNVIASKSFLEVQDLEHWKDFDKRVNKMEAV